MDEVLNQGQLALVDELFAASFVNHSDPEQAPGPAGVRQGVTRLREAFPDLHITIEDLVTQDDCVGWLYSGRGTHTGVFAGIEPTGRSVAYSGAVFGRVAHGQLVEGRGVVDLLPVLRQLGAITIQSASGS
jgi:predicted ester cyclase